MSLAKWAITHTAPIFIMASPITSYADQIWSMNKNRSSVGFSLDIPLIMLTASILKLFYWIGAQYATPLLAQAALMVIVQVLLLHVALRNRGPIGAQYSHTPFAGVQEGDTYVTRPYSFWQWRTSPPYWQFLGSYAVVLVVLQLLLGSFDLYTESQGYFALAVEAILPVPQILQNQRNRSCKGFRVSVVINWLVGDAFKLSYFYMSDSPIPLAFKLCAFFQTGCDIYLGVQYWLFGDGTAVAGSDEKDTRLA